MFGGGSWKEIRLEHVPRSELGAADLLSAEAGLTPTQEQFVAAGIPNGTTTYGHRPFEDGQYLHVEGTYYALSAMETGTATVERPVLTAERANALTDEVVTWADLSDVDSRALRCALASLDDSSRSRPCVLHAGADSTFTNRSATVSFDDRGEPVHLAVTREPVELARIEYTVARVGTTRAALADYVARHGVDVDVGDLDLSAEQRSMLETAADTGRYREEPPYSAAFDDLYGAFLDELGGFGGLVALEGAYYRTDLRESHAD